MKQTTLFLILFLGIFLIFPMFSSAQQSPDLCICDQEWESIDCGAGSCSENEMYQTKNCSEGCNYDKLERCDSLNKECIKEGPPTGEYKANIGGTNYDVSYEGIIPCGKDVTINGMKFSDKFAGDNIKGTTCANAGPNSTASCNMPCTFCHFFVMFKGVIDFFLFRIVPVVAVFMIVIGGFMFFGTSENPSAIETGKKIITSALVGFIIVFASWLIINLFLASIGVSNFEGINLKTGWWKVECPIELKAY